MKWSTNVLTCSNSVHAATLSPMWSFLVPKKLHIFFGKNWYLALFSHCVRLLPVLCFVYPMQYHLWNCLINGVECMGECPWSGDHHSLRLSEVQGSIWQLSATQGTSPDLSAVSIFLCLQIGYIQLSMYEKWGVNPFLCPHLWVQYKAIPGTWNGSMWSTEALTKWITEPGNRESRLDGQSRKQS